MKTYRVTKDSEGNTYWYNEDGEFHREDGPAIERADGTKKWYLNGQRHREDGPAYEGTNGTKSWWRRGQRHREDGPAYEGAYGDKEWWIEGKRLTKKEFNRRTQPHREMTVAQLEQELGYKIKIVKE